MGKITVRELKVKGKTFVTTLIDVKTYPKQSLSSLYKRRWEIETDLGQITWDTFAFWQKCGL